MRLGVLVALGPLGPLIGCGERTPPPPEPVATTRGFAVYDAYAPASPAPDVASLYFTLVKTGGAPDTLESISTARGQAMLHTVVTEKGATHMAPAGPIALGLGDTLKLRPGSYHVMIEHLSTPVVVGDTLVVELGFASGIRLAVPARVLTYTDVIHRLEAADRR